MTHKKQSFSGKTDRNPGASPAGDAEVPVLPFSHAVGIGASAGGHEALEHIFTTISTDSGLSFIVVMHHSANGPALLADLISHYTAMRVVSAEDGMPLQPNIVHVAPPGHDLTVEAGRLRLHADDGKGRPHHPIDRFFTSLAADLGKRAVAVVLSGAGTDGSEGVKRVKEGGGVVLIQEPGTAINPSMPQSAIAAGVADCILSAKEIADRLVRIAKGNIIISPQTGQPSTLDEDLHTLFSILQDRTQHDFSAYKRNTVLRRIERRMIVTGAAGFRNYLAILKENPQEVHNLCQELLIGVTSFFRDPDAFELLRREIIPAIFADRNMEEPVRIWHACCSTGEEAYSVAMLILEYLEQGNPRAKMQIFATDLDEAAVAQARSGLYSDEIAMDVGEERLNRFFTRTEGCWQVARQLREMIVFAPHNIIKDPPFSRLDLLVCRNFLIYLNPDIQKLLIPLFHQVLKPGGFLFLGSAETVGLHGDLFTPVDKKWKIFMRQGGKSRVEALFPFSGPVRNLMDGECSFGSSEAQETATITLAEKLLLDRYVPAHVIINGKNEVMYFSSQASAYLLTPAGKPTRDLLRMAKEELRPALRAATYKAFTHQKEITYRGIKVIAGGASTTVNIVVVPLNESPPAGKQALVIIEPVSPSQAPSVANGAEDYSCNAASRNSLVRQLEEQLRVTGEQLQSTSEQLETSNEKFMLANEELMTVNEELQSSNEELQSTNEELVTVNSELQKKMEELDQSNSDLNNLFTSSEIAVIILDRKLTIKRFSPAMAAIFNLIPGDIGRPFRHLNGMVEWSEFSGNVTFVLDKLIPVEREVVAPEEARSFIMRILPYRSGAGIIEGVVITLLDITQRKRMEEALQESERRLGLFIEQAPASLAMFDTGMRYLSVSRRWLHDYGLENRDLAGLSHYDVFPEISAEWREAHRRGLAGEVLQAEADCFRRADGSEQWIRWEIRPWTDATGKIGGIVIFTEEITAVIKAREVLRRYELLARHSRDIILFARREDGRVLEANDAALQAYGYSREEMLGLTIRVLCAPETIDLADAQMEAAEKGGILYETVHRRKDGTLFPVEVSSQGAIIEGKRMLVSVIRDITERKRVDSALRASESRYRELVQNAGSAIIHWACDGTVLFFNEYAQNLFGYRSDEIVGRSVNLLVPEVESTGADLTKLVADIVANPERFADNRNENICRDGRRVWMAWTNKPIRDENGQVSAILAVGIDITGRKRAEEALLESRTRLEAALASMTDAVFISDAEGRFIDFNDAFATFHRFGNRDECAKTLKEYPEFLDVFMDNGELAPLEMWAVPRALRGEAAINAVYTLRRRDTGETWVGSYSFSPIRDAHGMIVGSVVVGRDITESKRNEEERIKLETQLHQAQKMEAVGQLAGGVAHDFNNMLGVILGHAEMAMDGIDPAQPLYADLREIRNAAQRSADITRQLLAFARKQTVVPKVIDLNATVEGMLKMLRRLIGEDIELAWIPGFDLWPVKIDPAQVDQILANLCVNARDAISGIGKITVGTGNSTFNEEYCNSHADFVPGDYVMLVVNDNGCGISKDMLVYIFEPFFTTKGVGEGTGLGLATVYGAVKQNNGLISVYSVPGRGTTFRIYLPRYACPAEKAREDAPVDFVVGGHETILLVEDEPSIMKMTSLMLQRLGYSVIEAATPGEAGRFAGKFAGDIHLLVTDVIMPEMNGKDLAEKLVINHPGMKCLFMSGYTGNIIAGQGVMGDGVFFIQKPFSRKGLAAKVREVLDR